MIFDEKNEIIFDETKFQKWQDLRNEYRTYKKQKEWDKVIIICNDIIELDKTAKFICIFTPLFYKEIANAYEKLQDFENALRFYQISKAEYIKHRKEENLNKPDDFLGEIEKIDKKIVKSVGEMLI